MRRATLSDVPLLINLMTEFYLEGGYKLDVPGAGAAFSAVLVDERLGYVWIIDADGAAVGHVVVTVRFAMEFGA